MPYLFGGLIILNAAVLVSYLFFQQPSTTQSLKQAQDELVQPIDFINSSEHIPPPIGTTD
jgi:hypothetical protein